MIGNLLIIRGIVEKALDEDVGSGDITTDNIFYNNETGCGKIIAKEKGIVAGLSVARLVFEILDPDILWEELVSDGDEVKAGDYIARVTGKLQAILTGERVALNFMQRLSAIATYTHTLVKKTAQYNVKILDTRKTTPGLRILEKYAVRVGGGTNHRFGLYDAAIVKDNHIRKAGSIASAVLLLKKNLPVTAKIEVEAENMEQVSEALAANADIIMLDNMSPQEMQQAVRLIDKKALVEASGGVSMERIEVVAASGVDFISVGALTHSIQSMDISLEL